MKPKWSAPTLAQVKVNSRVEFKNYDETKKWAEIIYDGKENLDLDGVPGKDLKGWIPLDQLSNLAPESR